MSNNAVLQETCNAPVRGAMVNSLAARMEAIRVPHGRFMRAVNAVGRAIQFAGSLKEAPCQVFSGPAGVGKSTLAEVLRCRYPTVPAADDPLDADPDVPRVRAPSMPLLVLNMPTNPTPNSVCKAMLEKCGDPDFDVGTGFSLERRLDKFIQQLDICAILLDEAQRLVDRASLLQGQAVLDWMKDRHAKTRVVFILVGLGRVRDVLGDPQLWRRYETPLRLLPYQWRSDDIESKDPDRADFLGFLKAVQHKSPIPFSPEVDMTLAEADVIDIGKRFFCASQGRPGLLMKVLIKAAQNVDLGLAPPLITRATLALAFDEAIGEQPDWLNPFSKGWKGEMCPAVENDYDPADFLQSQPRRRMAKRNRSSKVKEAREAVRKR